MDELAKRRLTKANDSTQWTPQDCLEVLLDEVKSGKVQMDRITIIAHVHDGDQEGFLQYQAGVTALEQIGMLQVALHDSIGDFKSG